MEWIKISAEGEVEFVSEEVKLVPEVRAILALDYNKGKGDFEGRKKVRAKKEMQYLFLAYSPRSPYKDFNEEERIAEAKLDCVFEPGWTESKELKALVPKFKRGSETKVVRLLSTVEKFVDKFEKHLNEIDLNERNANQGLVHSAKSIMETLERLPRFAETLQELEQQAKSGVIVKNSSKGDHEVGWMATTTSAKSNKKKTDDEPGEDSD